MSRGNCQFSDKFEEDFPFIKRATGNNSQHSAFCTICKTTFSIKNKGKHDIKQHATSKKHVDNAAILSKDTINSFFKKKNFLTPKTIKQPTMNWLQYTITCVMITLSVIWTVSAN